MAITSISLPKPFSLHHSSATPLSILKTKTYRFSYISEKSNFPRMRKVVMTLRESPAAPVQEDLREKPAMLNTTALVTVKFKKSGNPAEAICRGLKGALGQEGVILQLVSNEVDPKTMKAKLSKEVVLKWSNSAKVEGKGEGDDCTYKVKFDIDPDFGIPGGIQVRSQCDEEFFLVSASVGEVRFICRSWVQPEKISPAARIFFCDKAYLPSQTPSGLIELRRRELTDLKGDGNGSLLPTDRIYDYDVYNDLGRPDSGPDLARPTLGGNPNYPYPRRCRTGRPPTATDKNAESAPSASLPMYVPRDEDYEEQKQEFMAKGQLNVVFRNIIPVVISLIFGEENFYLAVEVNKEQARSKTKIKFASLDDSLNGNPIVQILRGIQEIIEGSLNLNPPKYISEEFVWGLPDDEFGRRVLAGHNPVNIEKLKIFPPVSKLDSSIYGPQESALKEEHIASSLEGMSVQQAMDADKLFVLNYHDIYLPFVDRINAIEARKMYATRTIFFLTSFGTLKPIAIELSLPAATDEKVSRKRVLTPPTDGATDWLWELGKEHVCTNDAAIHAVVNHWMKIHASMEVFVIATHRNLSVMHPIFKLLHPHTRYFLKTNGFTRDSLINANGIFEANNAPAEYCMQLSSSAYQDWRFDLEGLPEDLITRGIAVPDSTQPHGLKLSIEDYPYAQDGLLIWSAIENLVTKYVNYYYPEANLIQNDTELQAWYSEAVETGHGDLAGATWWPKLSIPSDLISILTTIIWKVTGQHAVHNFGQYPYAGYIPARPPFMRKFLPSEQDPDYERYLANPREYFLSSIPSFTQAAQYAAVLDLGSGHAPDEEYIGERKDLSSWGGVPEILEAFDEFSMDMKSIEEEIVRRNSDSGLRNRCGGGAFPFELLIPSSESGTTSRGVPNSVTA
ncbi:linoleate 13S-lipoxygenase 3-1, chloroplastic-like [Andrographis paniculata]|uniref:linoleate 13S-lipoxygenase 3-1, chloroplastic-like n=1 Tax=Andrographis paniculata TaxID=175694 RepID=UPI0021E81795|nr:linoleate 13S-lipoxygenase 3-1, chloroplastic-like [Andrographis paniculata]